MSGHKKPNAPHWVLFFFLDGSVALSLDPIADASERMILPRRTKTGMIVQTFLVSADNEYKKIKGPDGVHIHYIRYFEVYEPLLIGVVVH